MKTCSACNVLLPLDAFYLRKAGRHEARCKKCFITAQAAGIRQRQERNIEEGNRLRATGAQKVCVSCEESLPYILFNRAKKNTDGHANKCAACSRPYARKYYEENRNRIKDSQIASRAESVQKKREYLISYYRNHPCVDCGETNILVLQADHQRDKKYEIATLINSGYSVAVLRDELEKCVTRCANCHQIVTAKTFNFWRLEYA